MEIRNKYGNISGGYIFDFLDRKAHELAIDMIGECVTSSAEIKYFREIEDTEGFDYFDYRVINTTNSTTIIVVFLPGIVTATFTFVKKK